MNFGLAVILIIILIFGLGASGAGRKKGGIRSRGGYGARRMGSGGSVSFSLLGTLMQLIVGFITSSRIPLKYKVLILGAFFGMTLLVLYIIVASIGNALTP